MIKQYLYNKHNVRSTIIKTDKAFKLLDNRLNVIRKFPSKPSFEFTTDKVIIRQIYYQIGRKLFWKNLPRSYKKRIGRWNKEIILKYKVNYIKKWKKKNIFFRWRNLPLILKLISKNYYNLLPKKLRNSLSILINNKVELRIIRLVSPLLDSYILAKLFASNSYYKSFRNIFNKIKLKIRIYDGNRNPYDYFSKLDLKLFYNSKIINQILSLRTIDTKNKTQSIRNTIIFILLNINNIKWLNMQAININNKSSNKISILEKEYNKWNRLEKYFNIILYKQVLYIINILILLPFNQLNKLIKWNTNWNIITIQNENQNKETNKLYGINIFVSNLIKLNILKGIIIQLNNLFFYLLNSFNLDTKKNYLSLRILKIVNSSNKSLNNKIKWYTTKININIKNFKLISLKNINNIIKKEEYFDLYWLNNNNLKKNWNKLFSNILYIQNYLNKYIYLKYKHFFNLFFVKYYIYKAIFNFNIFNKLTKFNKNNILLIDLKNFIFLLDNKKLYTNKHSHAQLNLVHFQELQKLGWVKFLNKSSFFDFSININTYIYKQNYINIIFNNENNNNIIQNNNELRTVLNNFFVNKKQNLNLFNIKNNIDNLNNDNINKDNFYLYENNINNLDKDYINNLSHLLFLKNKLNEHDLQNKQYYNKSYLNIINLNKEEDDNISTNKNSILDTFKEYTPYTLILGLAVIMSGKINKKSIRKTVKKNSTGSFSKIYYTQTNKYTTRNKVGSFTIKVSICQAFLDTPRKQLIMHTNNINSKFSIPKLNIFNLFKLNNSYTSPHIPLNNIKIDILNKKTLSKTLYNNPKYAMFKQNYYTHIN